MIKFYYNVEEGRIIVETDEVTSDEFSCEVGNKNISWQGLKEMVAEICGLYLDQRGLTDIEYMIFIRTH